MPAGFLNRVEASCARAARYRELGDQISDAVGTGLDKVVYPVWSENWFAIETPDIPRGQTYLSMQSFWSPPKPSWTKMPPPIVAGLSAEQIAPAGSSTSRSRSAFPLQLNSMTRSRFSDSATKRRQCRIDRQTVERGFCCFVPGGSSVVESCLLLR